MNLYSLARLFICVALIMSLSVISKAQTKTAGTGNWNNANTWSPSGVPGDNELILIPPGVIVTVRGTDHTLNNSILVIQGRLSMETTCEVCFNYGSLTFTGPSSGVIIEDGGRVTDDTAFGGDTHFISVQGTTFWSGDNCSSNCGTTTGDFTSSGETLMPATLSNPLPVEMLYFTASCREGAVLLKWATAAEINNNHFEVERSLDSFVFGKIGEVSGSGQSSNPIEYSFEDRELSLANSSILYYRLKQLDFDGQHEYSNTVAVYHDTNELLKIWPSPFVEELTISLSTSFPDNMHVRLYDMKGREWFSQYYHVDEGMHELNINGLYKLPPGIYFLNLEGNSIHIREKVTKFK